MPKEKSRLLQQYNVLLNKLIPQRDYWEEWDLRKYKILIGICLTTVAYATFYYPWMFVMDYVIPLYSIPITVVACFIIVFLLRNSKSVNPYIHAYVGFIILSQTTIILSSGGIYNNITDSQFLEIPVLVALLLLNLRWTFFYLVIGIGIIVTLCILESFFGYHFPALINPRFAHLQTSFAVAGHLLVAFMVVNIFQTQKTNALKNLAEKQKVIEEEKDRSEKLLLNILPEEVALELKKNGNSAARLYDNVSVLFTDFVDFTGIAENLSPTILVNELHECFSAFDEIMQRNGLEKIKTIGDAYMAVSGLPAPNPNHAQNAINAALEVLKFIDDRKSKQNAFEIRTGISSGPVVAGIVGVRKFAYDIWGDTVNTAARMEQYGAPGKLNISQSTFELVPKQFQFESRGKIEAKNKGAVEMYFVAPKVLHP